ncbi:keratin, type II cytoskeletal cochleal-like [Nothoprocta perdicaria]|uniref:keratin, type II cytoskeletal cochleal-like n=1 Tax=Nothoprocta perdicaria TaxID=30464 RepID=UPI000E1BA138|nr:keratin, type II cytoskeletal cochleal-like [Nothoprocta perdicaria]
MSDTSVIVKMDHSRGLSTDDIIADIKAQHEDMAKRSRADAERWCYTRHEELRETAGKHDDSLRNTKDEIRELDRMIQRLNGQRESTRAQRCKLEGAIAEAEEQGEVVSKDAKLSELEVALQEAKQDLAWQLHEDQELMNVKLALDMDITTYSSCWRESRAGESLHIPEKRLDLQCISHHRPSQAA